MKLRIKITFLLISFLTLLTIAMTLLNSHFGMQSYLELQKTQKNIAIKNVNTSINDMINRHEFLLIDWSNWDATLDFIEGKNENFGKDEIVDKMFIDQKINFIIIYDEKMNVKFKKGYDYKNNRPLDVDSQLAAALKGYKNQTGILEINGNSIIFSSSEISNSNGDKDKKGLMVIAHEINMECETIINSKSNFETTITKHNGGFENDIKIDENKDKYYVSINKDFLNSNNHISFDFSFDKDIEILGKKNLLRTLIYTILTVLIFGGIIYLIVLKFVKRLEKISSELLNIKSFNDTNYRVEVKGADEVSILSMAINSMLDKILNMNKKLVESATYDLLTGVLNRRSGLEKLDQIIEYTKKTNDELTICFIDINDLKMVNDKYGHRTGDEYIKNITEVVIKNIRDNDFMCRLGGDEFLIVFKGCTKDGANNVIKRINKDISHLNEQNLYEFKMSISKGIVTYSYDLDIDEFVELADKRMYIDKKKFRKKNNKSED